MSASATIAMEARIIRQATAFISGETLRLIALNRKTGSVVAPTPNLDPRSGGNPHLDWARLGPRYRDELLATLEARGWTGLTGAVEVEELATPLDWAAQGMAAGTPFALAHTFGQTGPFRPPTLPRTGPENVVLAGSSVQPGVGVPMVLLSGRLAAERITGPVRS